MVYQNIIPTREIVTQLKHESHTGYRKPEISQAQDTIVTDTIITKGKYINHRIKGFHRC